MEYFIFVLVCYFYDFFSWDYGCKWLKIYDHPQQENKREHKNDYFDGTDSSYLLKNYQELKNKTHYQTLLTKIVYVVEIWYFNNMKKSNSIDELMNLK